MIRVVDLLEILDTRECIFGVLNNDSYGELSMDNCDEIFYDEDELLAQYGECEVLELYTDVIVDDTAIRELQYSRWIGLRVYKEYEM